MSIQSDYAAIVPRWEGRTAYLYQDSEGNATCAEGLEVLNLTASQALPWLNMLGQTATAAEITSDWERVMSQPKGMTCTAYQNAQTELRLDESEIDRLTLTAVDAVYDQLLIRWPALPTYPEPGQLGLMDLGYNLGVPRLLREYPTLCGGMDSHGGPQWSVVAAQCGRDASINSFKVRNAWTVAQFNQADNA
jgi:hypothetical protein